MVDCCVRRFGQNKGPNFEDTVYRIQMRGDWQNDLDLLEWRNFRTEYRMPEPNQSIRNFVGRDTTKERMLRRFPSEARQALR